jgi:hypothetical protein
MSQVLNYSSFSIGFYRALVSIILLAVMLMETTTSTESVLLPSFDNVNYF